MDFSEHESSIAAYEAACEMPSESPLEHMKGDAMQHDFALVQAMLLYIQFGAFSGEEIYLQRSQCQFASVCGVLKAGLETLKTERSVMDQNWSRRSFIETYSRLAVGTCILSAILVASDPCSAFMVPYQ